MKILYIITGLGRGGAERVVCDLADHMFIRGHEVKIVYLTGEAKVKPINNIELYKLNLNSLFNLYNSYNQLRQVVTTFRPDVIHSHMIHANILTRLIRLSCPIKKLICTAHSNNEGGKLRMLLYRLTNNLADLNTNVSYEATKSFEIKKAVPIGTMKTIYNGINLDKYFFKNEAKLKIKEELGISDNEKILLAVGRFDKAKDYPNLLNAISIIKEEGKYNFKLLIAGEGYLKTEIEAIITTLKLEENVILLGYRSDIPDLMSAADIFLISSIYEGFGLVVAEAMACNCFVIATDCGGVVEILNNKDFIVPPRDSISLAKKIINIINLDACTKKLLIEKNRLRVEKCFALTEIVKKWESIYNE